MLKFIEKASRRTLQFSTIVDITTGGTRTAQDCITKFITTALIKAEARAAQDYEEVLTDHRRLVKKLDEIMGGTATQPSLCDVVAHAPLWKQQVYALGGRDALSKLGEALALIHTPEHSQDDEWHAKRQGLSKWCLDQAGPKGKL